MRTGNYVICNGSAAGLMHGSLTCGVASTLLHPNSFFFFRVFFLQQALRVVPLVLHNICMGVAQSNYDRKRDRFLENSLSPQLLDG